MSALVRRAVVVAVAAAALACPPQISEPSPVLTLEPAATTLYVADSTQFTAALRDAGGNPVEAELTWRTDDARIATVTGRGVVHGRAAGATVVRVRALDVEASAPVTVVEDRGQSLTVEPLAVRLFVDNTVRFTATLRDRNGTVIPATPAWSSSNPAVATVDAGGLARALAEGGTTIRAAVNELQAEAVLTVAARPSTAVLVGAGDIASCSYSGDERTAELLDDIPGTVFTAGDNAYPDGTAAQYRDCYGPSWGRHKARTRPSLGNHEYHTPGAFPYFEYFGAAGGEPGKGYYSYDLGGWHVVVLNSNLLMGLASPQEQWLRQDLAANPSLCTLAYWHHPRFSSGRHGGSALAQGAWDALYEAGADVIIVAHDHTYERFAPQDPQARYDGARGIRQFVVGTGGASLYEFRTIAANSEVRNNQTRGVLKLTLHPDRYEWEFVPVDDEGFSDSGSASCR